MKSLSATFLVLASSSAAYADDIGRVIQSSVNSDPTPDPLYPPHSAQVLVPSHGMGMNALFYLAGVAGLHPTMVLTLLKISSHP
jgi:hypothetical protein